MSTEDARRKRRYACKKRYRACKDLLPGLRAEVDELQRTLRVWKGGGYLPPEPERAEPPPGLDKKARTQFVNQAREKHNHAVYVFLKEQKERLQADIAEAAAPSTNDSYDTWLADRVNCAAPST